MPVIHKAEVVPYTQEQMYDLVNDIPTYKEFVPYCTESSVLTENEDEKQAKLAFSASGIQKSFTTMNRLMPHKMIELRLVDGPFKQLEGFWSFEAPKENHCCVTLNLEFEFASRILAMIFGPVFNQVAVTLVESFTKRAQEVY